MGIINMKSLRQARRAFGGAPGGPREVISSKSSNTDIKISNDADLKYHTPKVYGWNDMFLAWVSGKFPVDRISDKLTNDNVDKYSAYHYWGTSGLLQRTLFLKPLRFLFHQQEGVNNVVDSHANFHGLTTHENGLFLY